MAKTRGWIRLRLVRGERRSGDVKVRRPIELPYPVLHCELYDSDNEVQLDKCLGIWKWLCCFFNFDLFSCSSFFSGVLPRSFR